MRFKTVPQIRNQTTPSQSARSIAEPDPDNDQAIVPGRPPLR
jgi:hypothetical protein